MTTSSSRIRWIPLTALLAAAGVFAAGCGSDDKPASSNPGGAAKADKPVRIAFFTASLSNTYGAASLAAAKAVAKNQNATVQAYDGAFDPKKQFAQVQDAITSGKFDAFVIVPLAGPGIAPALEQAIAKDIEVAVLSTAAGPKLDTPAPQIEGSAASVLDPGVSRGKWLGGLVESACKGQDPCKVILIPGTTDLPFDVSTMDALKERVSSNASIKIVATAAGEYLAQPALKATQDLLQAHPDVNVIASNGDQMAVGVVQALESSDRKAGTGPDDVKVIGLGASEPAVKGIQDGTWFGTALSLPYDEGEIGTQAVVDAVRGKLAAPVGVSASEKSGMPLEVTKATLPADFKPQWKG